MKTMYLAFLATVVITVGAYYGLKEVGFSAAERTAGAAVRLK